VRQEAGVAAVEALAYRLRAAELLLVVDNCEHLLDACAGLAGQLLGRSPGLRVLATSREALGLPGEIAYVVRPLPAELAGPGAGTGPLPPAVRLLLDRGAAARGAAPGVVASVPVAERICRALDGLPLAIELAAARLGTLSAADVEAQLADTFTFLAARRPAGDPRHQALQAALDWSYDLLTAAEREVFEQLSVFAGSRPRRPLPAGQVETHQSQTARPARPVPRRPPAPYRGGSGPAARLVAATGGTDAGGQSGDSPARRGP
jgi:predicted ATPase